MQKPIKVVIIHGSYGSPESNWFPWLKSEIEKLGYTAIVPRFPTPDGQNFLKWKSIFEAEVGLIDDQTILIGHSIGTGFILSLLNEADANPAKAVFLIAGFLGKLNAPDYDTINATFVCGDFNWQRIKHNIGKVTVLSGDNDPYVPTEKGEAIADALDAPLLLVPYGGHLNTESGFTTFPLLLKMLEPLLN